MENQGARGLSKNLIYPVAFISQTALSVFSLSIPILAYELKSSPFEVGLVGGSMGFLYCFAPAIFGRTSDSLGRKSLVVAALLVYSCLGILFPLSRNILELLILGVLTGLSNSLLWPSLEALTVEVGGDLEGALRNYNLSWGLGVILGPSIAGGLISLLGIEAPFLFVATISFPTALLVTLVLKEPRIRIPIQDGNGGHDYEREYKYEFKKERVQVRVQEEEKKKIKDSTSSSHLIALGIAALQGFFTGILLSIFPAQAVAANVSPWEIGLATLLSGITRILAFYLIPILKPIFGRPPLLTIGIFFHSIAFFPLSIGFEPHLFYITFLLVGLASGITYATSLATLLEDEGRRGGKAGSFESMIGLGYFLGPIIGGAAANLYVSCPYIICLALSLLAGIVQVYYLRKTRRLLIK